MRQIRPFYTVIEDNGRFSIQFVEPPDWDVQEFDGGQLAYRDPAEAIGEFKKYGCFQCHRRLTKAAFERRILHYKQDMEKLKTWVQG
jgi:hypothetical protein